MRLVIRGAVQLKEDTLECMDEAVGRLFAACMTLNKLLFSEIDYTILSQTKDLKKYNAATSLRNIQGSSDAMFPLFCVQEADIEGSTPRIVRIMIVTDRQIASRSEAVHVYLDGASALRPDLVMSSDASKDPCLSKT